MDFKIVYRRTKTSQDAFDKVLSLLNLPTVKDDMKILGEVSIESDGQEKVIRGAVKGSSFTLFFKDKSAEGILKLSFLMLSFKGLFMRKLETYLTEVL